MVALKIVVTILIFLGLIVAVALIAIPFVLLNEWWEKQRLLQNKFVTTVDKIGEILGVCLGCCVFIGFIVLTMCFIYEKLNF